MFARGHYANADASFCDGLEKSQLVNPMGFPPPPGAALLYTNRAIARAAVSRYREGLRGACCFVSLCTSCAALSWMADACVSAVLCAVCARQTSTRRSKFRPTSRRSRRGGRPSCAR
jgi:hypothetical protein